MIVLTDGTIHYFAKSADRCHVADSSREVIRFAISNLKKGVWDKIDRTSRKKAIRSLLNRHAKNGNLYVKVVTGRI